MNGIDLIKEWFRFAFDDLRVTKHLFEVMYPKPLEIICYHCQQSAEKALKGYLLYQQIEPPKTHDLVLLYRLCLKCNPSFQEIANFCADITNYGVAVRYPEEAVLDETIAKSTIQKAEMIYDFCWAKIPELSTSESCTK